MLQESARLLDRATSEQSGGQWSAAARTCEELFEHGAKSNELSSILEAVIRLGNIQRQTGNFDLAEDYVILSLELAALHHDSDLEARAWNIWGAIKQDRGDPSGAEVMYLRALEVGEGSGDNLLLGNIEQNLGTLANIRGDFPTALRRYQAGLRYFEEVSLLHGCATVYNNLGMLHVDHQRLDEADKYFQLALQIFSELNYVVNAGIVHLNRTEMFLARGDPDRARVSCDEAFEIASRVNYNLGKAEALKFYGIIYRETGKPHLAEIHLREAIETAGHDDPLLEAEAQRELSLVLRAQQRNRESLSALNRSHSLFKKLQAQHDQADVDQRIAQLEKDFLSLVRSWGESIEAKDRYTSGHCQRVADYACRIAEEAGISATEMTWFRMGAFLHDVGKTEVPAEILNKPGRLTDEERLVMERHTVIGDDMLAPVEFPWDIRPMVRSHHERWDGRGYPDRLVEEAIPFTARILRIADIFDALTTARSYRKPLTPEEAFQIMEEDEGSFDPRLFRIFRGLFPELAERARGAFSQASDEVARAGGAA